MSCPTLRLIATLALGLGVLSGCSDGDAPTQAASSPVTSAPTSAPTSAAASGPTTATPAPVDTAATKQWLYVLAADGGSAAEETFTLSGLDPNAIAFTDRPVRKAKRFTPDELISAWASLGFVEDPPNAALAFEQDGGEQVHTVTLSDPVIDGDEVTFDYVDLDDDTPLAVGQLVDELPSEFGPVSLVIDDGSAGPDSGVLSVTAITEDQYNDAKRRMFPCRAQGQMEVCQDLRKAPGGKSVVWTAVAAVGPADFSTEMEIGYAKWSASASATGAGPWVRLTWESPAIPVNGTYASYLELQVDEDSLEVDCDVRPPPERLGSVYDLSCTAH